MDGSLDLVREAFAAQCEEGLATMEAALLELEQQPGEPASLNIVFRVCHTLKGDAGTLGFTSLVEFSHALEDLLESLREGTLDASLEVVSLLLEVVDHLRTMVADALGGQDGESDQHRLVFAKVRELLLSARSDDRPAGDDGASLQVDSARGGEHDDAPGRAPPSVASATLRVRLSTLDRLLDLTGELSIARGRLSQAFVGEAEDFPPSVIEAHEAMDQLFSLLQGEVMRLRMVPIGPLFQQQQRVVRDLAVTLDKRAVLEIEGGDAELDTAVIEHMREPLGHMIRNALAHGIEPPEERAKKGKPAAGRITLRARRDGASILVELTDDGAGLDRDRIREQAAARGLLTGRGELRDAEVDRLIFEPGFSTAASSSLASGRGVGMDVVRSGIEALGGSVAVESEPGQGCVMSLRLPLTLAIVDGFAVGVGDEVFILPLGSVSECMDYRSTDRREAGAQGVISLRGASLPYLRLGELLQRPSESRSPRTREGVVVLQEGGSRAGLVVDELLGEQQAVIKPLERGLRDLPALAGSTILSDGRVALVLDAGALLRLTDGYAGAQRGTTPGPPDLSMLALDFAPVPGEPNYPNGGG